LYKVAIYKFSPFGSRGVRNYWNRRKTKIKSALGIAIVIFVLILTSYYVNSRYQIEVISSQEEHINIKKVEFHEGFSEGKELSFDLDWNNQSNGCYLTASLYLCPTVTTGNPGEEKDWLKFEYVGVPQGRNARCVIAAKRDGKVKYLYTEGWPEQRCGRHIAYQRIKIVLDNESLKIIENGTEIYCAPSHGLEFTSAYRYLQMSSHSNYPAREIYFDNVVVVAC